MGRKYEPASEPLYISAKWLFLKRELYLSVQVTGAAMTVFGCLAHPDLPAPIVDIMQWYRGGLVFEAHRLLYHST